MSEVASVAPELTDKSLARAQRAEALSTHEQDFDVAEGWNTFRSYFPELAGAA